MEPLLALLAVGVLTLWFGLCFAFVLSVGGR